MSTYATSTSSTTNNVYYSISPSYATNSPYYNVEPQYNYNIDFSTIMRGLQNDTVSFIVYNLLEYMKEGNFVKVYQCLKKIKMCLEIYEKDSLYDIDGNIMLIFQKKPKPKIDFLDDKLFELE